VGYTCRVEPDVEPEYVTRESDRPTHRVSLLWRVFIANAAVLLIAYILLVVTPVRVTAPTATFAEALILLVGLIGMLILNLVLLQRSFAPLRKLTALMAVVDPMEPGRRVIVRSRDAEVAALTDAFNTMLDRLEVERRESGRRALAAQEESQLRIARELHDEIGQTLTAIVIQAENAADNATDYRDVWTTVSELAKELSNDIRRISRDLRPEALDDLGLVNALIALCTRIADQSGIEIERRFARDIPPRSEELDLVLYRVAQESLTNAMRHSDATRVVVALEAEPDGLVLTIRDNGRGVEQAERPGSTGIIGMRERAMLVHGRLTVRSKEGAGTEVKLAVPVGQ
jgi:two-component system, NarL family, sensor histidine kinase UhpB